MTKFTSEDKMNAVIHYQDGSESIKDIARSLGANHEVVRMWIIQFEYPWNPGL
ncbi:TPA: transposase [Bacillus cereus]|uniref:transposase n=1 Tax=Bacillus cereus TaxID=1396 RepID=UPI001C3F2BB3|nr:transposase [Bacillus cereus]HDR8463726.1 transposase [Bacillus cereus]